MNDRHETIGVIIPTYNRINQTVRAVDSVLCQSIPVKKILVIDDGSDENVFLELQSILNTKGVDIIRIAHTGHPGIVREAGRIRLETDWIAFLDSDDSWNENKLERIFLNQKRFSADAICSLASGTKKTSLRKYRTGFLSRKVIFQSNPIINSSVVIKSQLLKGVGGIATSYSVRGCEDYATWLRVSDKTKWLLVSEELVRYEDDSSDSVRKDEEFKQDYSNISALLDYVLYAKGKRNKKFIFLRMILKHLWRVVK